MMVFYWEGGWVGNGLIDGLGKLDVLCTTIPGVSLQFGGLILWERGEGVIGDDG